MFHPLGPSFFELARQALSSTERGYDLLAPKFDYTPFRTSDFFLELTHDFLAGQFGTFESALDVCCGTGAAMEAIRPLVKERLCGIDMSAGMIEVARRNLVRGYSEPPESREQALPKIDFVRGNVLQMPFADEFDLAVSFGAFGHIRPHQETEFIEQMFKVLKPGGRFVFVTHEMPGLFSPARWIARGFNGAMHLRNLVVRPPFIMFYLTFLWPDIEPLFEQAGFSISATGLDRLVSGPVRSGRGSSTFTVPVDTKQLKLFKLVVAQKKN